MIVSTHAIDGNAAVKQLSDQSHRTRTRATYTPFRSSERGQRDRVAGEDGEHAVLAVEREEDYLVVVGDVPQTVCVAAFEKYGSRSQAVLGAQHTGESDIERIALLEDGIFLIAIEVVEIAFTDVESAVILE